MFQPGSGENNGRTRQGKRAVEGADRAFNREESEPEEQRLGDEAISVTEEINQRRPSKTAREFRKAGPIFKAARIMAWNGGEALRLQPQRQRQWRNGAQYV